MAGDGTEENGYIENVFEEYQISMTAQQFIAACLTGDIKTAVRYSGVKEELRNSIREGTPGSGTRTSADIRDHYKKTKIYRLA